MCQAVGQGAVACTVGPDDCMMRPWQVVMHEAGLSCTKIATAAEAERFLFIGGLGRGACGPQHEGEKNVAMKSRRTCSFRVWNVVCAPNSNTSPSHVAQACTRPASFRAAHMASPSPGACTTGNPCRSCNKLFQLSLGQCTRGRADCYDAGGANAACN